MNKQRNNYISCTQQEDGSVDITIPAAMVPEFCEMVKKGTNCSPNMHVEIRDFTDRLFGRESWIGTCMKTEIYGYPTYAQMNEAAETEDTISIHWGDIPSDDRKYVIDEKEQAVLVTKSLLREPISATNPLPPGCYCKPGKCSAPKPSWCRDANKRDAKV